MPGTYRLTAPLKPLNGQTLVSIEPRKAILNGSALIPSGQVSKNGPYWMVSGQTQQGSIYDVDQYTNTCVPAGYQGCKYPEQVFLDDRSLWQVTSLSELSAGEFYFDYGADKVYIADDPTGRELEIGIGAVALEGGTNVTVDGLVVEKFNTPASTAALRTGTGWKVLNCEVRYNNGGGTFSADGSLIKNSYVHHNGQAGTFGHGDGAVLDGVEVAFNGINGYNTNWEGGGSKFVDSNGLTVRNSHYHDNTGIGIWFDIDNINTVVDNNRSTDNTAEGIVFEIGYKATVSNNTVTGNAKDRFPSPGAFGAGILIVNNRDVEVYGNTVVGNFAGISAVQQSRGSGRYGLRETANLYVHDNIIGVASGFEAAGIETLDCDCYEYFDSKNNRWQRNTYLLGDPATQDAFEWKDAWLTFKEWQALGMDTTGTIKAA